jgi:hypothetical protein
VNSLEHNGCTANSPDAVCDLWGEYYAELLSPLSRPQFDNEFLKDTDINVHNISQGILPDPDPILQIEITHEDVKSIIKDLKHRKAPGPDTITNEHVHYGSTIRNKHLANLFNMMNSFRIGSIIPLYKGNNKVKSNASNYRGITLTSVLGKLFECILLNRIETYLASVRTVFPHKLQCGFRKGYGATIATYILKEVVSHYMDRGSNLFTAFLDNEKAIDRIWHSGLLLK